MNLSTGLFLVGGLLLVGSALGLLAVSDMVNERDTDYHYAIAGNDSSCANIVSDPPDPADPDDFRVDYTNLSETGQQYFERALADGRYVVEDEADTHFGFPTDYTGPGSGCYAVNYSGETYALETITRSHRSKLAGVPSLWIFFGTSVLFVVGFVLAGVGLGIKQR